MDDNKQNKDNIQSSGQVSPPGPQACQDQSPATTGSPISEQQPGSSKESTSSTLPLSSARVQQDASHSQSQQHPSAHPGTSSLDYDTVNLEDASSSGPASLHLDHIILRKQSQVTYDPRSTAVQHTSDQQGSDSQTRHQPAASSSTASNQLDLDRLTYGKERSITQHEPSTYPESKQPRRRTRTAAPLQYSLPRPHPFYLKPQHIKTNYKCPTTDGWKLHLIRTRQLGVPSIRHHPVILCPGLGSSGAYSFDLSPNVSLADYLASQGWDVWTVELRGESWFVGMHMTLARTHVYVS